MTAEAVSSEPQQPDIVKAASPEPAPVQHQDSTTDENAPMVIIEKEDKITPPCCPKSPGILPVAGPMTPQVKGSAALVAKKQHLEQRLRRHVMWGSLNLAIFCGRLFTKLGVKNAEHVALRKTARLAGGLKRSVISGIAHSKAEIAGVKCRIYKHVGEGFEKPGPVLLYSHGGGWVICSARSYHPFCLGLCRDTGATVVSIDYRLAPEHPYPAGLEDCFAVTKAILNAEIEPENVCPELKGLIDPTRVVLGGDSAGGNLAAAVALDLLRAGDNRLNSVMLICPALQAITQNLESYKKLKKYPTIGLSWFLAQYAGIVGPKRKLLKLIDQGRHIPEETGQRLIQKYMTAKTAEGDQGKELQNAAIPDSGCQTASSSLPSPDSQPSAEAPKELVEQKSEEGAAIDKVVSPTPEEKKAGEGLLVPVTVNTEEHVETDHLIEKSVEIPESITELSTCVRAWPMLAEDNELAKLPATFIQVCSEDPLLDEGRIFADRMRLAGARDVRFFLVPRAQHAEPVLGNVIHSKAAKRGYAEIVAFFKDVTGLEQEHKEAEARQSMLAAQTKSPTPAPLACEESHASDLKPIEEQPEPVAAS